MPALRVVNGRLYAFTGVTDPVEEVILGESHVTVADTDSGRRVAAFELSTPCEPGSEALLDEDGTTYLYCAFTLFTDKTDGTDGTDTKSGILRQELTPGADGVRTPVDAILGNGQVGAPELSVTPGRVLFVAPSGTGGELVAVDPVERTELWRRPLASRGMADAPPVQAGDRVYVANTRGVAAYEARTGKLVYQHSVPSIEDRSGIEFGLDTEPMVAGGIIYAPSSKAGWVSLDTEDTGDTGER